MSDVYVVTEIREHDGYGDCEDVNVFASERSAMKYVKDRMNQLKDSYRDEYGDRFVVENDGFKIRPDDLYGTVDDVTLDIWVQEIK